METYAPQVIITSSAQQRNGKEVSSFSEVMSKEDDHPLVRVCEMWLVLILFGFETVNTNYPPVKLIKASDPVMFNMKCMLLEKNSEGVVVWHKSPHF